jgi:hypothetical protein
MIARQMHEMDERMCAAEAHALFGTSALLSSSSEACRSDPSLGRLES